MRTENIKFKKEILSSIKLCGNVTPSVIIKKKKNHCISLFDLALEFLGKKKGKKKACVFFLFFLQIYKL